jgi:hypothetical protein
VEFARNACAFGQARVLSGQLLLPVRALYQLIRHLVKVVFQLSNFVPAGDWHSSPMVAASKICRCSDKLMDAAHQPTRGQQAKQAAYGSG